VRQIVAQLRNLFAIRDRIFLPAALCQYPVTGFQTGDWVLAQSGWQEYAVSNGKEIAKLGNDLPHPTRVSPAFG
jgi:hypothetical protein